MSEVEEEIAPPIISFQKRAREANITDLHAAIHHITNAMDSFRKECQEDNERITEERKITDEIHECFDEIGYAMTAVSKALSRIIYS